MSTDRRLTWSGPGVVSIAEIGLNHGGSAGRALEMVDAAADAGATAIKLQSIVADELVTAHARRSTMSARRRCATSSGRSSWIGTRTGQSSPARMPAACSR